MDQDEKGQPRVKGFVEIYKNLFLAYDYSTQPKRNERIRL